MIAQSGDGKERGYRSKKYTACGLMRRECPLTSQTALAASSPTKAPLGAFVGELRFTRGDVVILSLLPQSGILSPRRPANCGAVRPIHRIVDKVAISLYNRNTYSYSMKLAEKGDFIDEF